MSGGSVTLTTNDKGADRQAIRPLGQNDVAAACAAAVNQGSPVTSFSRGLPGFVVPVR